MMTREEMPVVQTHMQRLANTWGGRQHFTHSEIPTSKSCLNDGCRSKLAVEEVRT